MGCKNPGVSAAKCQIAGGEHVYLQGGDSNMEFSTELNGFSAPTKNQDRYMITSLVPS